MPSWPKAIFGSRKGRGSRSKEPGEDSLASTSNSTLTSPDVDNGSAPPEQGASGSAGVTPSSSNIDVSPSSSALVEAAGTEKTSGHSRSVVGVSKDQTEDVTSEISKTNGSADSMSTPKQPSSRASTNSLKGTPAGASEGQNGNADVASTPSRVSDIHTTHTILANPLPSNSVALNAVSNSGQPPGVGIPNNLRTFDIDDMISRLLDAGYSAKVTKSVVLKNAEITAICQAAREVFLSQPTLVELSPPVKIVGDVHGQYCDLIRLFEMCGFPPAANYLFLGDYVDRGKQSLETILLLLCYKIKYPENFFLLRGNHECANVTRVYGFYDECKRRCNIKVWKTFIDVFNCLPIAAIVASKIFCVHGGLSPSLSSMDDIRRITRPSDVPDYGLLNDLLWSDPSDTAIDWEDNERGVSYCFGKAVIQDFLGRYDFDLICRAHMVVEDGYEFWNERTLVTIFSAPNYCGEFDNFAAVMSVSEDLLCAFELLKPLDGPALKKELAKSRRRNRCALC